jgi:hypothetical protein
MLEGIKKGIHLQEIERGHPSDAAFGLQSYGSFSLVDSTKVSYEYSASIFRLEVSDVMTSYGLVDGSKRFLGICCLYLWGLS